MKKTEAQSTTTNSSESYEQQNIQDLNEIEQVQQRIAKLQVIVEKITNES